MTIDLCSCLAHQHLFDSSKEGEYMGDADYPFGLCGKALTEGWAFCRKCEGLLRPKEVKMDGEQSYCEVCFEAILNMEGDEYEEEKLREDNPK